MALNPGTRLGPYEILSAIGAGGMGEVYRALDTNLGRQVAIKILPDTFAHDPERLARFEREAKTLAVLNHPNIAQIYGLEKADGIRALVLELVEGPTLADRIAHGPIPLDEALPIARQIADALEAAHEAGVIHRDLKPANVKMREDGTVKVLDFGLAKALEPMSAAIDASQSPTITSPAMTRMGVILGTAAYMSPEQARGKPVDKRSDIWAFGCVLYEMLTGKRAFGGDNITETLASIITKDVDWQGLPAPTPQDVRRLLRRCLERDRKRRLADIADARFELDFEDSRSSTTESTTRKTRIWPRAAWGVFGVGAALITFAAGAMSSRSAVSVGGGAYRAAILPPPNASLAIPGLPGAGRVALSPDGTRLAFVAVDESGRRQLWVQPLDGLLAQPLAGTDEAAYPFWSPDSRFIAFQSQGRLKKVDASGGAAVTICDYPNGLYQTNGGTWNADDIILFSPRPGSVIYRVQASGGTPIATTRLDADAGETEHWAPFFLPDGRRFLFFAVGTKAGDPYDPRGVYVGSLDSDERTLLIEGGRTAMYARGHLLFVRGATLMAQPFDPERVTLTGEPVALADDLDAAFRTGGAAFTVSQTGILAYQSAFGDLLSELVWVDRTGKELATVGEQGDYGAMDLSPDNRRVGVSLLDSARRSRDLWIYEAGRGVRTRLTFDPADESQLVWSADSTRVAFNSRRKGVFDLYLKSADGVEGDEMLVADDSDKYPVSWSADGRFLLYRAVARASNNTDLWVLPLVPRGRPRPFVQTPFAEAVGRFSPDARWVAYRSDESGREEIYVGAFPGPGSRTRVSVNGGDYPVWRNDGRELFYLAADNTFMAAAVNVTGPTFTVESVRPLFSVRVRVSEGPPYAVSNDAQRFLVNAIRRQPEPPPLTVVINWPALVR